MNDTWNSCKLTSDPELLASFAATTDSTSRVGSSNVRILSSSKSVIAGATILVAVHGLRSRWSGGKLGTTAREDAQQNICSRNTLLA